MHIAQPLIGHMRIYLRGGHIRMPEQFLHTAQIGTVR
jgi:hypothetical protein